MKNFTCTLTTFEDFDRLTLFVEGKAQDFIIIQRGNTGSLDGIRYDWHNSGIVTPSDSWARFGSKWIAITDCLAVNLGDY